MEFIYLIIFYLVTVFIARALNILSCKVGADDFMFPSFWIFPIVNIFYSFMVIIGIINKFISSIPKFDLIRKNKLIKWFQGYKYERY